MVSDKNMIAYSMTRKRRTKDNNKLFMKSKISTKNNEGYKTSSK